MPIEPRELDHLTGDVRSRLVEDGGQAPMCPGCGYNLTGLTNDRCPECGRSVNLRDVLNCASALGAAKRSWNDSKAWVSLGFKIAIGGCALWLLEAALRFAGWVTVFHPVVQWVSMISGVAAVCLGLGVLRIFRMPEQVRVQEEKSIPVPAALGAVGLGALLIALVSFGP